MKFTKKSLDDYRRNVKQQESRLLELYTATSLIFEDNLLIYESCTKLMLINKVIQDDCDAIWRCLLKYKADMDIELIKSILEDIRFWREKERNLLYDMLEKIWG